MDKNIRLSGILYESLANGPGIRRVFFSQGCKHNCPECFNPETHDFNGGFLWDMDELIEDVKSNPMIKGVTFSGGDPLEQAEKFAYMARKFKEAGLNIWSYTGYTFEYILDNLEEHPHWKDLIESIDVLVDGRFEVDNMQEGLKYIGSNNQRLIDVQNSLKERKAVVIQ